MGGPQLLEGLVQLPHLDARGVQAAAHLTQHRYYRYSNQSYNQPILYHPLPVFLIKKPL